ncbi:MAG: tetratricopeptide repeat protein [Muribaculaceae bacterium]|nr:tetratricopeptide repeat protein [Muribaculaceae bacterium]
MRSVVRFMMCLLLSGFSLTGGALHADAQTESVRKERRLIIEGNKLYEDKKYREAAAKYQSALEANGSSAVATYNLGLTRMVLGSNPADTSEKARKLLDEGKSAMQSVAAMGQTHPELASRANYNLGNVAFNANDFAGAIQSYKEALRLNPGDDSARRNLRIAQLKQQNQDNNKDDNKDNKANQDNKDQNKDQNKDNKDQEQNKQDQNDQNRDQNQDKNDKQPPRQDQSGGINEQTADRILKAMENKENQTRGRVGNAQKAKGSNSRSNKNW